MRLFRAVRAVGLSLYLCAVCARLRAVYAPCGGVWLDSPGFGGAVRWFAGCAPVTSLQCFPTPTAVPPPRIRDVRGGSGRSVLQHCAVLNKGKPCGF